MILPLLSAHELPHLRGAAPSFLQQRTVPLRLSADGGVVVRDLSDKDVWQVASLLRTTFASESNALSGVAIVAEHIVGLRERRKSNIILVAVAEETGEVQGTVECFTSAFLASQLGEGYPDRVRLRLRPYLASLAVRADARRCGVASSLVRGVEERVTRGPLPHVLTLEVEEGDEPAIALYRKLGYDYVRREDGRRLVGDILFGRSVQVTRLRFEKDLRGAAASGEAQGQEVGEER